MPNKTKTALAALFILGPVSVVVLAGPNNRTDDHGSVRTVLVSKPFAEEAPIMISQDDARQGSMGHQLLYVLGSGLPAQSSRTLSSSFISLGCTHQAENRFSQSRGVRWSGRINLTGLVGPPIRISCHRAWE